MSTLEFPTGVPRTSRAGAPPKPTAQKILEGNRGRRPLDPLEPKPPEISDESELPSPPPHLTPFASEIWKKEFGPLLVRTRVLTEADLVALAILCQLEAERRLLVKDIKENGRHEEIETRDGVKVRTRPQFADFQRVSALVMNHLREFGFTPASRPKVQMVPEGDGKGKKKDSEEESYDPFSG